MRRTIIIICLALTSSAGSWACAPWLVDMVAGRAELARNPGGPRTVLARGAVVDVERGIFSVPRDGALRLRLATGDTLSLAGGSVVQFVRGGMWLRLQAGAVLVDAGTSLVRTLRISFHDGYVTPTAVARFSVTAGAKAALYVVDGAVRVARQEWSEVVGAGMKALWRSGEFEVGRFAATKLTAWWRQRGGLDDGPTRGARLPAPPVVPRAATTVVTTLPSGTAPLRAAVGTVAATTTDGGTLGRSSAAWSVLVPRVTSVPFVWWFGAFVLVVGTLSLVLTIRRGGGTSRPVAARYTLSGVMSGVLSRVGFGARCPSCNGEMTEGVIAAVPVDGDVERNRPTLMAYESSDLMDSLWDEVVRHVHTRRLLGKTDERVVLSYSRCKGCLRTVYRLSVGDDTLAEYAGTHRPERRERHSRRLNEFVRDYDPYFTQNRGV